MENIGIPENLSKNELELINKFTKRELNSNEIYAFSLVLCDNEIDRDYERFTSESLEKLADLFVGKTGIFDHDAKSKNQSARIFSCKIETPGEINSVGEPYRRLVAKAYVPRSEKNKDFILSIDSGIKKEVSVRCSVALKICSVCGMNINICEHKKGRKYKSGSKTAVCHAILECPIDAYEWSFVAIPSQRAAGVIKSFDNFKKDYFAIFDQSGGPGKEGCDKLFGIFENLKQEAKIGKEYAIELKNEAVKLFSMNEPEIERSVVEKMTRELTLEELKALIKVLRAKVCGFSCAQPQFMPENDDKSSEKNSQFQI